MNGVLTFTDETTQEVKKQSVFIPYIIFLDENSKTDDVGAELSHDPSSNVVKLISELKNIEHDHDYSVTQNLTPLIKTPLVLDNVEEHNVQPTDDTPTESAFQSEISVSKCATRNLLLDSIKPHNRVLSFKSTIDTTTGHVIETLIKSGINVSDVSTKPGQVNGNKRILLIGSQVLPQCPDCSKPMKPHKVHICKKKTVKDNSPKPVKRCYKCGRDIRVGFMSFHLAKHTREERKKLEYEKEKQKLKEAIEQARMTCGRCNEKFDGKEEFEFHLQLHPPFTCEICGKGFIKKESLKVHMNSHNAPNSFICEICGKGFKDAGTLRSHLHVHENRKFNCNLCPKVFKSKAKLNHHVKCCHYKSFDYQCTYCGRMFAGASILNTHVKLVHLREKPYQCVICHRKFGRMDYLNNHMARHTGKPQNTNVSSIGDGTKKRKKFRYMIQDNGGPFLCKLCGKSFQNVAALKRHLTTHVKRYSCQFCPLTFSSKALSQRHEKIHEGGAIKFFRCDVCWKRFGTEEALDVHSACHKNARYACDLCKKTFNRRYLMNHHKLVDHIDTSNQVDSDKFVIDSLLEVTGIQCLY